MPTEQEEEHGEEEDASKTPKDNSKETDSQFGGTGTNQDSEDEVEEDNTAT